MTTGALRLAASLAALAACRHDAPRVRAPVASTPTVPPVAAPEHARAPRWLALDRETVVDVDTGEARRVPAPGFGPPLTDDVAAYTVDEAGAVAAMDPASGAVRWRAAAGRPCALAGQDEAWVYCVARDGVHGFRKTDGAPRALFAASDGALAEAVVLRGALGVVADTAPARVVSATTGAVVGTLGAPPAGERDNVSEPRAVATTDGRAFCALTRLQLRYALRCADAAGRARYEGEVEHTTDTVHHRVPVRERYLYFVAAGARHLLFSSRLRGSDVHRAVAIRVDDGARVADVPAPAVALVEDDRGALVGLLARDRERGRYALLDPSTGATRWTLDDPHHAGDAAVLRVGGRLVVARFNQFATGASLVCVDLATGALAWTADVEQLGVRHSEYLNEVTLRARGGDVVMVGDEIGGAYAQRYDLATGARRYATLCCAR